MERTCNSCKRQTKCKKLLTMSEDERDELSCTKYEPMPFEQYVAIRQERLRTYMIPLKGAERYFV
ncbi:MAG: hypothetical protein KBH03_07295 [Paludibacteraceae bacterium]|nr:hypothetical protein [Paludibacteraceae bacterium]